MDGRYDRIYVSYIYLFMSYTFIGTTLCLNWTDALIVLPLNLSLLEITRLTSCYMIIRADKL